MKTIEYAIFSLIILVLAIPVFYVGMLLWNKEAKLVFKGDMAKMIEVENKARVKIDAEKRDSLYKESSLAYLANVEESERLKVAKEQLLREQDRLEAMKLELKKEREELEAERALFVKALEDNDIEHKNRVKKLAKVYEAMDAEEAARLMETLDDSLCIDLFNNMSEVRQKAEIFAVMNGEKASRLSKKMGITLNN